MVKYALDSVFTSLSDPTRRDILQRLATKKLTVSEIAIAYNMSLAAVSKHLKVLENAKLITKQRRGRQLFVQLSPHAFQNATEHLHNYETLLTHRLDSLETYLGRQSDSARASFSTPPAQEPEQRELVITHLFDAPRERVWQAYTDPEQIAQWWGPRPSALIACQSDARAGGLWRFVLRGADNHDYIFSGRFHEVSAPERLVYTDGFGEADQPRPEALVTVTLEALPDGKTKLTKRSLATSAVHQLQAAWLKSAERKLG